MKSERIQMANIHLQNAMRKAQAQQAEWRFLPHRMVPSALSYGEWRDLWQGLQGRFVSDWKMDEKGGWAYWRSNSGELILKAMTALGEQSMIENNMRWDTCVLQVENEEFVMACQWRWWQSPY